MLAASCKTTLISPQKHLFPFASRKTSHLLTRWRILPYDQIYIPATVGCFFKDCSSEMLWSIALNAGLWMGSRVRWKYWEHLVNFWCWVCVCSHLNLKFRHFLWMWLSLHLMMLSLPLNVSEQRNNSIIPNSFTCHCSAVWTITSSKIFLSALNSNIDLLWKMREISLETAIFLFCYLFWKNEK